MGEIAGVGEAGKDVFSRQARVVGEDFIFGLAGCQEFQDEFDGQTSTADDCFAGDELRIEDDTLWQEHKTRLCWGIALLGEKEGGRWLPG